MHGLVSISGRRRIFPLRQIGCGTWCRLRAGAENFSQPLRPNRLSDLIYRFPPSYLQREVDYSRVYKVSNITSASADLRDGPAGKLPGVPRSHWNSQIYSPGTLRFSRAKELPQKLSAVRVCACNNSRQLYPRPKKAEKYSLKGAKLFVYPGRPQVSV